MRTLSVNLGKRSYPIHIGASLLQQPDLLTAHIDSDDVLIVSNEIVAPLYQDRVIGLLQHRRAVPVTLPDGEGAKTLDTAARIFDALVEHQFDRESTLIALGGGVVGDLTGFAAACYQRGIAFIQIPTTLLAQVDASVGGKTAVNHPRGKNLIGAFHQPRCVLIDIETLGTLPEREYRAGLAEVIKYGLALDADFFSWLEANMAALVDRRHDALIHAIERSCALKADVVQQDERDLGTRMLLNLGHTFAHAIETVAGYGVWLHGEAVAAGMVLAAEVSCRQRWLDDDCVTRIETLIETAGLPVRPPALDIERVLGTMRVDKKVTGGEPRLILLRAVGDARVSADYSKTALAGVLRHRFA